MSLYFGIKRVKKNLKDLEMCAILPILVSKQRGTKIKAKNGTLSSCQDLPKTQLQSHLPTYLLNIPKEILKILLILFIESFKNSKKSLKSLSLQAIFSTVN